MQVKIILAPTAEELVRYLSKLPEEGKTVIFCEDRLTLEVERAVAEEKGVTFDTSVTTFARFLRPSREKKVLSKQGSVLVVGSIAAKNAQKLRCFGKNPAGAAARLYETIAQLRAALVTPEMLEESARGVDGNLAEKLADIALVYREYLGFLSGGYLDESGVLALLPDAVADAKRGVSGAHAVFAGFTSFTRQAAAGIAAAVSCARAVTGVFIGGREDIYTMEAARAFEKYCKEAGAECAYETLPSLLPPEADKIRTGVFGAERGEPLETGAVHIYEAADADDELSFIAAMIKKEVLDAGLRYRDMALLLSDPKDYAVLLEKTFSEYNIPYFSDVKKSAAEHPLCRFLINWLNVLAEGFAAEEVCAFVGSEFFAEPRASRDIYRNYLLRYANFRGGVKKEISSAGRDTMLLTALRGKFLSAFEGAGASASVTAYCAFLRALMEKYGAEGVQDDLSKALKEAGYAAESEFMSRGLEVCLRVLSEAESLDSGAPMRAEEFASLLRESFASVEISLIPQKLDAVFVGSLSESKKTAAKVLFAGRLTSDVPPSGADTALISDRDIDRLRALRVEIEPKIREVNARAAENCALALAGFTQRIYLSYPLSAGGKECKKSEAVDFCRAAFTNAGKPLGVLSRGVLERSERFNGAAYTRYLACAASEKIPALRRLLTRADDYRRGRSDFSAHSGLYAALKERGEDADGALFAEPAPRFVPEAASVVFKGKTAVAPTLAEGYFACPYRNFAERGLLLKEREEKSVRPVDTGNFMHEVLKELAENIDGLEDERACAEFLREKAEKLLEAPPYCYLKDTKTGGFSAGALANEAVIVGLNACEQLKNSDFSVFGAEKTFGYPDSPFPPVVLESGDNYMRLAGKIDRIDRAGDWYRVVDYKTGGFEVSAKSYYTGRKLQLELYLWAVSRGGKMAGAYYFPARVAYSGEDKDSPFRMQGYTVGDDAVVAMSERGIEKGSKSRYIDAYFGRKSARAMSEEDFEDFIGYSVLAARNFVKETRAGCIAASPYEGACDYCPYGGVCGFDGVPREAGPIDQSDIVNAVRRRKGQ